MLTQRLNRAVEEIGTTQDPPLESRLHVHRLIESVAMFAHPECRRSLNRTSRCGNEDFQQKTANHMSEAIQRSPVYFMLMERLRNATIPALKWIPASRTFTADVRPYLCI